MHSEAIDGVSILSLLLETIDATALNNLNDCYSKHGCRNCEDLFRAGFHNNGVYKFVSGRRVFSAFCEFSDEEQRSWMVNTKLLVQ